ncbi:saccharopine dehydrogenase [Nocardia sp. JW2]|uniref:saccharopine dehydrogenase n=1 Tax=Nocardia sp. JW2 TaxID=3450738 RepID=UPI003F443F4D
MTRQATSVLIMGGSGQAGAGAAAVLRQWYPDLELTIAGRDIERARRVAESLGGANAVTIDITRADLGLPADAAYSAVVAALWDDHLHGLGFAARHGVPYLSLSSGLLDIAPEVVAGGGRASAAPILLASHYLAGIVVLATLAVAAEFERVERIGIAAALDDSDTGGPAGIADMERWSAVTTAGLIRRDGVFTWVSGDDARADVRVGDGVVLAGQSIPILDVPSLALATGAPNVRFDLAVGESAGRRRGGGASLEVVVDVAGTDFSGAAARVRRTLAHPAGQRPLTALGIALGVERLLGLRGAAVPPGVHLPEALIDPAYALERMAHSGATFEETGA